MLRFLFYRLGEMKYNNKIQEEYLKLKESETYTLDQLKAQQLVKLKELLVHAYEKSEFYRQLFDEANVSPYELETLEDLRRFPLLTKEALRAHTEKIQIPINEKSYYSRTSGSTGKPLGFYRNQSWDAIHRASILRGYSWHGVKPHEKNGYLKGYHIDKKEIAQLRVLDFLQNRFRIFSYEEREIESFLKRAQSAAYIEGYSSMVYKVAKAVNANPGKYHFPNLKMVKGTSETIFDSYRTEVQKAFGLNLISEYGSAESGIIAFECEEGNMHITMENVIVEEIDGEIVVTNLSSHSLPIIRYKLGDYIELAPETYACACGKAHPVLTSVFGRVGNPIQGYEHAYPSMIVYYVFGHLSIKGHTFDYQVIQHVPGELEVNIEQSLTEEQRRLIQLELYGYFKDDLDIEIKDKTPLQRGIDKLKPFVSHVDQAVGQGQGVNF